MGLVKMGWVGLDGTKLRANASRHQAMSYDWLVEREPVLAAEVDRLRTLIAEMFADAEATDLAEDARFGADGRQGDLPGELARRETRLAKMRAAKHDLETEAADRARAAAQTRAQTRATPVVAPTRTQPPATASTASRMAGAGRVGSWRCAPPGTRRRPRRARHRGRSATSPTPSPGS